MVLFGAMGPTVLKQLSMSDVGGSFPCFLNQSGINQAIQSKPNGDDEMFATFDYCC